MQGLIVVIVFLSAVLAALYRKGQRQIREGKAALQAMNEYCDAGSALSQYTVRNVTKKQADLEKDDEYHRLVERYSLATDALYETHPYMQKTD